MGRPKLLISVLYLLSLVRRVAVALIIVIVVTYLFIAARNYTNGLFKKELVSQLNTILGGGDRSAPYGRSTVSVKGASIDLFPPAVHIRGLVATDNKGGQILNLNSVDAYISLLPLLYNKLVLQKIFIDNLSVDTSLSYIQDVIDRQKKKPPKKKGIAVELRSFNLKAISLKLNDDTRSPTLHTSVKGGKYKDVSNPIELSFGELKGQALPNMAGIRVNLSGVKFYSGALKPKLHERLVFNTIGLKLKAASAVDAAYDIQEMSLTSEGLSLQANGRLVGKTSQIRGPKSYNAGKQEFELHNAVLQTKGVVKIPYLKRLLALKNPGHGQVSFEGPVSYDAASGVQLGVSVDGRFYVETLLELLGEKEPIQGDVSFKGTIKGPLKKIRGEASAALKKGSFYGIDVDGLSCKVIYDGPSLKFITTDAKVYNGLAKGEVTLEMPVVNTFTVDIKADNVDSKSLFKLIKWDPGLSPGKVHGTVYSNGSVFNPKSEFVYKTDPNAEKAAISSNRNILERINEVTGRVEIVDDVVNLHDIVAKTGQSEGNGSGVYDLKSNKLQLRVNLNTREVVDLTKPSTNRLAGSGTFNGDVTGTGEFPVISGTVKLDKGNFWGFGFTSLRTHVHYSRELLEVIDGCGDTYTGTTTFGGTVHFKDVNHIFDFNQPVMAFDVAVKNADARGVSKKFLQGVDINGNKPITLNTSFKVSGPAENLKYAGDIDVRNLRVEQYPIDLVYGSYVYYNDALSLQRLSLKKSASEVSVSLNLSFKDITDGSNNWKKMGYTIASEYCLVHERDIPYAVKPPPLAPPTRGGEQRSGVGDEGQQGLVSLLWGDPLIQCKFSGKGTFEDPYLEIAAWAKGAKTNKNSPQTNTLTARLDKNNVTLLANILEGNVEAKGKAGLLPTVVSKPNGYFKDVQWSLDGVIRRYDYAQLNRKIVSGLPQDLKLVAEGKFSLSGKANTFKGKVLMSILEGAAYDQTFSNKSPIDISMNGREVLINSFDLTMGIQTLPASASLTGSLVVGKSYNLNLTGNPKLILLRGLSDRISWLNGQADVAISIAGNWQRPQISGGVNIAGATLGIKNIRHYFNDINCYAFCDAKKCVVKYLKTNFGGGLLSSSGIAYIDGFSLKKFYMEGNLQNMPAYINDGFKAYLDGKLYYSGDLKRQTLSGDIKIAKARYTKNLYLQELILENSAPQLSRFTSLKTLDLNVNLYGDSNIAIENNVVESILKVDLLVKGTASNPILYGRIQADRGKVLLQRNEFDLVHASVDFTGEEGFNPFINALAETSIRGYNIRLIMDGQMLRANMVLSSFPPLPEKSIVNLLSEAGTSTLLTTKYQSLIEERLKKIGGFSRIQLSPSFDEDKSSVTPQVIVSKKFLKDKLNLSLTTTSTKGDIIRAQYLLNKNISLLGERNELGRIGADVNFRYEFK
ncbi:MAG: translocation/assembly module TamB domain-containing protein [Nitrospirae bacterium]|nr:translocation/assembly module TamB domain-containing protein [Nitrospirota bacterium]